MKALEEKYQDKEKIRKPSVLQNFFILCSGADRKIVNDFPTEWNKFSGIGATIFLTACLALLSGAYAIHFVFENNIISILFGIFWAIVIFNLDRYIVLSLRKEKIPTRTDIKRENNLSKKQELKSERFRLLWHQTLMASPRFIIALIIAVTVSKPIELRLFQDRIQKELENTVKFEVGRFDSEETTRIENLNNQLASINQQEENDKMAVYANNPIYQDTKIKIPQIENEIKNKEQNITKNKSIISANQYKETRYRTTINSVTNETTKVPYSVWLPNTKARGKIEENKKLEKEKQKLDVELKGFKMKQDTVASSLSVQTTNISDRYKSPKESVSQQIENLNETYLERKNKWINVNEKSADLPSRLEALGKISIYGNSIWWASLVITLLFIALETAPVVVKLLTKRGPYDERLDSLEYLVYIEENKKIDMLNREVNEYMSLANDAAKLSGSIRLQAEKDKLDVELRNNKKLLNKLADYQKELADIYADAWFMEEKAKAIQQAQGFYQQAHSPKSQIKLGDTFWKQKGVVNKIEYYFRNGSLKENVLLYIENDQLNKGNWNFNNGNDEITIELSNSKIEYFIEDLTNTNLKLKNKATNEIIELQKI